MNKKEFISAVESYLKKLPPEKSLTLILVFMTSAGVAFEKLKKWIEPLTLDKKINRLSGFFLVSRFLAIFFGSFVSISLQITLIQPIKNFYARKIKPYFLQATINLKSARESNKEWRRNKKEQLINTVKTLAVSILKFRKKVLYLLAISVTVIAIGTMIKVGYSQKWTGFGEFQNASGQIESAKTLWNWMDLLIVPATLSVSALIINIAIKNAESEKNDKRLEQERLIAKDKINETSLRAYLDKITSLVLNKTCDCAAQIVKLEK